MTIAIQLAHARPHVAGFTALELIMSIAISTVIVLATIGFIRTSGHSAVDIWRDAQAQSAMRYAGQRIRTDFRQASPTKLLLTQPANDNHAVRLQRPLDVTGSEPGTVWGVYARELGKTEAERNKPGWFVRYRVVDVTKSGTIDRQLTREYLDASGKIRYTKTLIHFLQSGTAPKPGFKIDPAGAMWQITLTSRVRSRLKAVRHWQFRVSCKN